MERRLDHLETEIETDVEVTRSFTSSHHHWALLCLPLPVTRVSAIVSHRMDCRGGSWRSSLASQTSNRTIVPSAPALET
jgi:hypothetical protein